MLISRVQRRKEWSSRSLLRPKSSIGKQIRHAIAPMLVVTELPMTKRSLCPFTMLMLTVIRKLNTSPSTVEDKEYLKKLLCTPPIKKIDLQFPLGLEVTARNNKGVTIKDALDAIHKQFKKKV